MNRISVDAYFEDNVSDLINWLHAEIKYGWVIRSVSNDNLCQIWLFHEEDVVLCKLTWG